MAAVALGGIAAARAATGVRPFRLAARIRHGGGRRAQVPVIATVEGGDPLTADLLDVLQKVALIVRAEGHGRAVGTGPGCPADPVHIGFRHIGQVVLDHVADRVDVDATRGDIGGHQNPDLASFEVGQGAFPLALALVAVDGGCVDAGLLQALGHAVCTALGAGEDDHALEGGVIEQFAQQGAFALLLHKHHALVDAFHRGGLRGDGDLQRVGVEDFARQLLDLARHGG